MVEQGNKPKTPSEAKALADSILDAPDQERVLLLGTSLFGISEQVETEILERWRKEGKPRFRDFAPYFSYLVSVEMFFYISIGCDLISKDRASNKVDVAYLYYLPFCMVFVSSDNLHAKIVPLFLREHQTFLEGSSLKSDLNNLNRHYLALPDEVKSRGVCNFAQHPPPEKEFLVTQLWDKYLPTWRQLRMRMKRAGLAHSKGPVVEY